MKPFHNRIFRSNHDKLFTFILGLQDPEQLKRSCKLLSNSIPTLNILQKRTVVLVSQLDYLSGSPKSTKQMLEVIFQSIN